MMMRMMIMIMFIFAMVNMNVDHLMDKEIWWEGTAPTACGEHGIELACCIKGR
jgi:hypothetical protein